MSTRVSGPGDSDAAGSGDPINLAEGVTKDTAVDISVVSPAATKEFAVNGIADPITEELLMAVHVQKQESGSDDVELAHNTPPDNNTAMLEEQRRVGGDMPGEETSEQIDVAPLPGMHIQKLNAPYRFPHLRQPMLRYIRRTQRRKRQPPQIQGAAAVLLGVFLLGLALPFSFTLAYGLRMYATYETLSTHAYSGVQHLLDAKAIFATPGKHTTTATGTGQNSSLFDEAKLIRAGQDVAAAHRDFVLVQTALNQTQLLQIVPQILPQYCPQMVTIQAASQIAIDLTAIGGQFIATGRVLAPHFHGSLLSDTTKPLVTASDLALVQATLDRAAPELNDIMAQAHNLSLDTLPLSASQHQQLQQYLRVLPLLATFMKSEHSYLSIAGWLLGVDEPRTFLVQPMDRGELRASGGFTGQYGELHVNGGQVAPFTLTNIALLEYAANSPTYGNLAPSAYRSWWPFANWGLRDANLSADFPTTARLAIDRYKSEVGHQVDGLITFTPTMIEQVLRAIGPITIPQYQETITAQNLEERLHYYQLDNNGIRKEEIIEHVEDPEQARKLFTSTLAHVLMDRVRHASSGELLALGEQAVQAMQTRDLQIYFSNPQAEDLLTQYGYAGGMDRAITHDGIYIVQTNVSVNKASEFVQTNVHDTIHLDAAGGATHTMQMRLVYDQRGPVYGFDTYRDYVRIYVPPAARFLTGTGFDSGTPLCGGPLAACPQTDVYPHNELLCPAGQYDAGTASPMLNDPYVGGLHPLDQLGQPTNFASDEPGRGMFGGYAVIPKNCMLTLTLSWYVPPMAQQPYTLLFQRQAGTNPVLDLTVLPASTNCQQGTEAALHFADTLARDMSFSLKPTQGNEPYATSCLHARQP